MPFFWSVIITFSTSASVNTRSPMTIALPLPMSAKPSQLPRARPALTGTPATVTERSDRGKPNLRTPSGCGAPFRPSAVSTAAVALNGAGDFWAASVDAASVRIDAMRYVEFRVMGCPVCGVGVLEKYPGSVRMDKKHESVALSAAFVALSAEFVALSEAKG